MVWKKEVAELQQRREFSELMGGEQGIAEQRKRGKLTVRERIRLIADEGRFKEIGQLAGAAQYEGNELVHVRPSNMVIGTADVNGRPVVVTAGDFTVRGGSADGSIGNKGGHAQKMALDWKLPFVRLLDATGGSVRTFEQIGRTYIPTNPVTPGIEILLNQSPVVAGILGSVAGLPAVDACLAHFNVMVKNISQLFPGGPPVVKAALGLDITKEELGDERSQVYASGTVDNLADTEEEAFEMIKQFLSYLPSNVWELAPRGPTDDDPERRDEALLSVIPREKRRTYNPRKILNAVLDKDSFFEITPHYGRSRIIGLARMDGYPVGVMINNPNRIG
ncbi:MAG: methylmalonyl-CoA carboxyltransferase, partial [Gammaproteobacteria bacterium]|nr:methylmalonyl-CoA carboxyltransferase [Gammaproteobacteria bacterium]